MVFLSIVLGIESLILPMFKQVSIVGVGLLGSSLGLALKTRGLAEVVVGVGRRQSSLDTALERGAIDKACLDLVDGVRGSDCVVLAGPAALVVPMLDSLRDVVSPECVVTDVASTKGTICAHADATWSAPRRFIGAHPMAGAEVFGPEHGRADFYNNTVCLLESGDGLDAEAREKVSALWAAVGAEVVDVDPAQHDAILAHTSHVPHIAASAIASVAGKRCDIAAFIGNGFKDTTRIADGRSEIWRDISLTNKEAILEGVKALQNQLEAFNGLLAEEDEAGLEAFFEDARQVRNALVHGKAVQE